MVSWLVSILLSLGLVLGVSHAMAATPPGLTCPGAGNVQTATAPNDGIQSSRFTRAGNPAGQCATPHAAPAVQGGSYGYDKYVYTNRSNTAQCITVTLSTTVASGGAAGNPGELQSAAYLGQGGFQPGNITANYLADSGPGVATSTASYSFNVAALADFEVVVTESNDGQGGGYTLNVAGCGQVVITGFNPFLGHVSGGQAISIDGSGFLPGATVDFGGTPATVTSITPTNIQAVVPAHAAGKVILSVTNPAAGGTATFDGYTYYDDIATTTTLTSSKSPTVFGESVTLTAAVGQSLPNPGANPPGIVTFLDGGIAIGTAVVSGFQAQLVVPSFSVGTHSLTATFMQDPAPGTGGLVYTTSTSAPISQVVGQSATTSSVSSSQNPSPIGSSVTFTATVTPTLPGSGNPTGTVDFLADGVVFAAAVALDANSQATASNAALPLGAHAITVSYNGDTNFVASVSPALSQTVTASGTTITIVPTPASPSTFGQSVTFTATLASLTGGTATGTVIFRDGPDATSPQIGTTQTVSGTGTAAITIATLSEGTHTIRAEYSGDANHQAVTGTLSYTVNAAATTTTLTSSVNPSSPAQSVTFTATVTSTVAGTIGGTVTFKDGANTLGTGTVGAGGVATLATTVLAVGSHNITAVYGGAGNYGPSTSSIVVQVVRVVSDAGPDAADAAKDTGTPDAAKADTGTGTDSGTPTTDSGTPKTDAGSDAGDGVIAGGGDDGCGCTTAGTPSSGALSFLMLAGVGLLVARRRKRSSR
jgi:MYXO-CTERM domain-containing protein